MIFLGPFSFDSERGLLLRDGEPLALGHRALALFDVLLKSGGGTVGKSELMDAAWPGTTVEEANLTVQIAALRKAMGPRPDGSEWITTVPRVGYRLPRPVATSPVSEVRLPAVAVLPFVNLSSDPEQDYFADGIADDLITALSRFRAFSVISRGSSFALRGRALDAREAGKLLGARYLLEGSFAPGTGAAGAVGGLLPSEFIEVLAQMRPLPLVAVDIVEVAPNLDPSGRTAALAVTALSTVLQDKLFDRTPAVSD